MAEKRQKMFLRNNIIASYSVPVELHRRYSPDTYNLQRLDIIIHE